MASAEVIVPCFDEAPRLDRRRFGELARQGVVDLLFVDDGSRDRTRSILNEMCAAAPGTMRLLALDENVGKGEAVRQGMNAALARGATIVGYTDADLSTPPSEVLRLLEETRARDMAVVAGSRVLLVGRKIVRRRVRHILGRVFATGAAQVLRTPFYDTQCGAKFFRASNELRVALYRPFLSRWAFDVELIGRLLAGSAEAAPVPLERFLEVPLLEWVDVPDSKVHVGGMIRALVDLGRIEADLSRRRKRERTAAGS